MPACPTSGTVPSLSCLVTGIQGTSYPQSICCPLWAKGHVIHYLNTSPTPPHPTPQVTKGAQPSGSPPETYGCALGAGGGGQDS